MHQVCARGSEAALVMGLGARKQPTLKIRRWPAVLKSGASPRAALDRDTVRPKGFALMLRLCMAGPLDSGSPASQADLGFCLGGLVTPLHPKPMFSGVASPRLGPQGSGRARQVLCSRS